MAVGPFDVIGGMIGVGLQIYGGQQQYAGAQHENQVQQDMVQNEFQQNSLRRQAMELMFNRQVTQNARNVQKAQAQALATGTSQNAQFGSGVEAGIGGASAEGAYNYQGLSQNLQVGENMFDLQNQYSNLEIQKANAQSQIMQGQAWSQLGGTLTKNMQTISSFGGSMIKNPLGTLSFGLLG